MRTILVVEDDAPFAYATGKHLEKSGYEVLVANGSMAALKILDSARRIDLVLVDVAMPPGEPHGIALARMARMKREGIKTAFMTAYRDLGIEGGELGPILHKPIDLQVLTAVIGRLFDDPVARRKVGPKKK
jgi:CheY-like chemotaxis protein